LVRLEVVIRVFLQLIGPDSRPLAKGPEDIGSLNGAPTRVQTVPTPGLRTWTDDYSNIIGAFRRKRR
jgi:hypothetical protein